MPRPITLIVIHCSASPNGDSLFRASPGAPGKLNPAQVVDSWHAARGWRRKPEWRKRQNPELAAIGYHFVIAISGLVLTGRHLEEVGAHAQGYNQKSIGICMVGTDQYSGVQWAALAGVVSTLQKLYPDARVLGHRDLSPDLDGDGVVESHEWLKTCPGFNVATWTANGMVADPDHTLPPASARRAEGS